MKIYQYGSDEIGYGMDLLFNLEQTKGHYTRVEDGRLIRRSYSDLCSRWFIFTYKG